jgi:hypothetical protein
MGVTEDSFSRVSRSSIYARSPAEPPDNELPAVLAPGPVIWRSADAAIALLALEVYTSGVEFTLAGRARGQEAVGQLREPRFLDCAVSGQDEAELRFVVRCGDEIVRLDCMGSTSHDGRSFRCRAWVAVIDDLTFWLEWPAAGISFAEHEVTGVRDAASRAVSLGAAGS